VPEHLERVAPAYAGLRSQYAVDVDCPGLGNVGARAHRRRRRGVERHREDVELFPTLVECDMPCVDGNDRTHSLDGCGTTRVRERDERGRVERIARAELCNPDVARQLLIETADVAPAAVETDDDQDKTTANATPAIDIANRAFSASRFRRASGTTTRPPQPFTTTRSARLARSTIDTSCANSVPAEPTRPCFGTHELFNILTILEREG